MSDLSKNDLLQYLLKVRNYDFVNSVEKVTESEYDFFIIIEADSISDKSIPPSITSYYQMMRIKPEIEKKFDIKIKWIVKKGKTSELILSVIEKVIEDKYPNFFESIAISPIRFEPFWIYIEKKNNSDVKFNKKNIINDLKPVLDIYDIKEANIAIQDDVGRFPANPIIVMCIKVNAPINLKDISLKLINMGYEKATIDLLKPKIETLRKYGLVVWSKTGEYSLSLNGQQTFTYVNPKNSSDVLRALELGRRKWDNK